ncbi:MAG: radical SAM protein [Opitutaceae bacterium]
MTWSEYTIELDKGLHQLGRAAAEWSRLRRAKRRVRPPTTLQFPINDICNSRCVMCDIWKRKRDHEITPEELASVLKSPFFSEVKFVGLSGGEPTLRRDLASLGEALCSGLPNLSGIHIISNGLRADRAISSLRELADVVRAHGKSFHVNISIDGIGAVHDQHRGRDGNFAACVKVIDTLRREGIPVGIGCTLTALNCHHADDVLLWSEEQKIHPVYFRLGVDIRRLYNEGFRASHAFTAEQRFHVAVFFEKLTAHPKMDRLRQQVSASLAAQIWDNAPRTAGCAWQDEGVTLDSRGGLSFCSVASEILGSTLKEDPVALLQRNVSERKRILEECCRQCQHDLIGPLPPKVLAAEAWETIARPWKRDFATLRRRLARPAGARVLRRGPRRAGPSSWRSVIITGWYGTETAGDKAVLGALLTFLREHAPNCDRVSLCTLNRRVCEQTLRELAVDNVRLVPLAEGSRSREIARHDAVVVGGGPLFPIPPLLHIQEQFEEAARQCRARVLFGCGVGPLNGNREARALIRILQLATSGFYRDEESRTAALSFGASPDLGVGFDPSLSYLRAWLENSTSTCDGERSARRLAVLMRANTTEYFHGITASALEAMNRSVAGRVAAALQCVAEHGGLEARLLPMHCLHVGGDDRLFNRRIEAAGAAPCELFTTRAYLPLNDLLAQIQACSVALPMRYHGHMFSLALARPFVSIDYSGGSGKVANLVTRLDWSEFAVKWADFQPTDIAARLVRAFDQESELRARLRRAGDSFAAMLREAYDALARV